MDKIQKQRSSIVLYREKVNGERYIRIKYANNPAIALLLSQESGIQMADNASAYITVTAFKLPDFSDRSSPYACIDINRKTFCNAFPNHFVSLLHQLTQNKL